MQRMHLEMLYLEILVFTYNNRFVDGKLHIYGIATRYFLTSFDVHASRLHLWLLGTSLPFWVFIMFKKSYNRFIEVEEKKNLKQLNRITCNGPLYLCPIRALYNHLFIVHCFQFPSSPFLCFLIPTIFCACSFFSYRVNSRWYTCFLIDQEVLQGVWGYNWCKIHRSYIHDPCMPCKCIRWNSLHCTRSKCCKSFNLTQWLY